MMEIKKKSLMKVWKSRTMMSPIQNLLSERMHDFFKYKNGSKILFALRNYQMQNIQPLCDIVWNSSWMKGGSGGKTVMVLTNLLFGRNNDSTLCVRLMTTSAIKESIQLVH